MRKTDDRSQGSGVRGQAPGVGRQVPGVGRQASGVRGQPRADGRAGPPDPPTKVHIANGTAHLCQRATGLALRNKKGIRAANSSGVALILTLGLLTLLTLAVVAFVVTMRIERLASGNVLNRTIARQYVDAGLSEALGFVNDVMTGNHSCYPVHGWSTNLDGAPHFFEQDCLGLPSTNDTSIQLFRGSATNLLPTTLAAQAAQVVSGWIGISETNAATGSEGVKAGRVSFLVVNLSGMMDVHALNADRCQALGEPNAGVTNLMNATGVYQRVFLTQPDLTAANGAQASNLVTFSYDPGPDVYFTNLTRFGTRAFTNDLFPRYNINLASNAAELVTVSNLLADAGVPAADVTAWNILNYLSAGQIPVGPGPDPAYRTGIGVKDVPLINEVVLEQIPGALTNHYGVSVELWYPFVPHPSPANCKLWVGIYTNAAAVTAEFATFNNNHAAPPSPLGFEVPLTQPMNYDCSNEFFIGATMRVGANPIVFEQLVVDSIGPPLVTHIEYLPVDADHPVWIWPRVYVDDTCVDEALVDATAGASSPVRTWTDVGNVQFADPRANHALTVQASLTKAPSLGTTNTNCTIPSLPLVHANAPMRSAGELRHIYAPGLPGGRIDFTTALGGACRDRFTVLASNAPVHGLFQANTPYTNIWQAILSDVTIGWTNQISPGESFDKIVADPAALTLLASNVVQALSGHSGWVCNQEMFPMIGSYLLAGVMATNQPGNSMDARAVCGDILAGIADRVSFRQNSFLIIVCGQRLSPLGRVLADQRAACTIVRDAYTGRWVVDHMIWLTE